MRLDLFLWYARLAKSRSIAADLTRSGTMRLDGRRVERAHAPVRVGSVLAFAQGPLIRIIRVVALPQRRGPAVEAAGLYIDLSPVDGPQSAQ
ncbi:MAG: RNA-binding S4 domain-containing protein [Sphingomonas sp.]|nr:RNA-binding S4 domain-containing protein [Sphingomonas sp.]